MESRLGKAVTPEARKEAPNPANSCGGLWATCARPDAPLGRWGIGRPSRCALSAGARRAYWYACIGTLALQLQPPFLRRRAGALDGAAPLASLHLEASLGVLEQWSLATVCVTAIASVPLSPVETGVACSPRGDIHMSAELLPHICVVRCDLPSWDGY